MYIGPAMDGYPKKRRQLVGVYVWSTGTYFFLDFQIFPQMNTESSLYFPFLTCRISKKWKAQP